MPELQEGNNDEAEILRELGETDNPSDSEDSDAERPPNQPNGGVEGSNRRSVARRVASLQRRLALAILESLTDEGIEAVLPLLTYIRNQFSHRRPTTPDDQ